jgi:hypothetical protein
MVRNKTILAHHFLRLQGREQSTRCCACLQYVSGAGNPARQSCLQPPFRRLPVYFFSCLAAARIAFSAAASFASTAVLLNDRM